MTPSWNEATEAKGRQMLLSMPGGKRLRCERREGFCPTTGVGVGAASVMT
jgi:hypothetical protein